MNWGRARHLLIVGLLARAQLGFAYTNPERSTPASHAEGGAAHRSLLSEVYAKLARAQDHGGYADAVKELRADPNTDRRLLADLVHEVEALQRLTPTEREPLLRDLFDYYSETKGGHYKTNALGLGNSISYSREDLVQGRFEPTRLAAELVVGISSYQRSVMLPMLRQVNAELAREFPKSTLLFLGRDFSPGYLWLSSQGPLDPQRLHLANVSRGVRDAALAGQLRDLRHLIKQTGLDLQQATESGLVIIDSGVLGKVPAAVLRALCEKLSPADRYRLLTHTEIRYLRSARQRGASVAATTAQLAGGRKQVDDGQLNALLTQLNGIREFAIALPPAASSYAQKKHNLFEHRPKLLGKVIGLASEGGEVRTLNEEPTAPSLRINSLLGLHADLALLDRDREATAELVASERDRSPPSTGPLISPEISNELDRIGSNRDALAVWQASTPPQAQASFAQLRVVPFNNGQAELWLGRERVFRLVGKLGEGRNVIVYQTDRGTALKIAKHAKVGRKQILSAWAAGLMTQYGIAHARVLSLQAQGLYLEQELVPGGSLEERYGSSEGGLPKSIEAQVVDQWQRAKKLQQDRGVWLDLKAANLAQRADGTVLNVDYVPRVNSTYYRYYRNDEGEDFTTAQFLDAFLHHDLRKKAKRANG